MPRAKRASSARCVKHGTDCAIAGGSSYRSAFCARVVPSKWGTPSTLDPEEPDAELLACIAEGRAEDSGIPLAQAQADLAQEVADGSRAWVALTPAARCLARDGEDAEIAEMVTASRTGMVATVS